jgi:hypothetical protein
MKNKRIRLILEQLGQQAFPDDIDPWTPIQNRLEQHSATRDNKQTPTFPLQRRLSRQRMAISTLAGFVIIAVLVLFSLVGEALADNLRHLFQPVSADELPTLSSELLATPTFAPTFVVTLSSVQEVSPQGKSPPSPMEAIPETTTSDAISQVPNNSLNACHTDPYGYTCQIDKAERITGFDAREFPADPPEFRFSKVYAEPGYISIEYKVIGGGGYLYLNQGMGKDFPTFTGAAQESAIEPVQVGDNPGEYLEGNYVYGGEYNQTTWLPCCRQRLRWTDGENWYELDKVSAMPQTDYMTRDVMIQMATELVNQPDPLQSPRLDYLVSLDEVIQVVEFSIITPTLLPDEFNFDYATHDRDLAQLRLNYSPPDGEGIARIVILQTPIDKVHLAPGDNGEPLEGESVDINGNAGIYFSTDPYSHTLTWKSGEIRIKLLVYSSEIWYGGSFTKDQILEIAKSMQ